jgi:hypothetical protein
MLGTLATAVLSPNRERQNEERAELAAMGSAIESRMSAAATPPPAGMRDPRPLAEAILGTWRGALASVTFVPDGTVVATLPGGRQERGRWSVGSDGKLRSNATGTDQAAEAWVAGDTLTISDGANGLAFQRVR